MLSTGIAVITSATILGLATIAGAQQPRAYAGGSLGLLTQPHSNAQPLGGTTLSGTALVGVTLSPRFSIEFEPTIPGAQSRTYSYRPGPSLTADVVARRRDTFLTFQLRARTGALEPIVGVSYLRQRIGRVATIGNRLYFEDERTERGWAVSARLDAPLRAAPRFYIVPALRLFVTSRRAPATANGDPLGLDTGTGRVVIRYGVGGRVTF